MDGETTGPIISARHCKLPQYPRCHLMYTKYSDGKKNKESTLKSFPWNIGIERIFTILGRCFLRNTPKRGLQGLWEKTENTRDSNLNTAVENKYLMNYPIPAATYKEGRSQSGELRFNWQIMQIFP